MKIITFDDLREKGEKVTFAGVIKMYKPDATEDVINKWFDKAIEDSSLKLGVDTTGLYIKALGSKLSHVVQGSDVLDMDKTVLYPLVQTQFPNGTQILPPISFQIDPSTGIKGATNNLSLIANG